MNIKSLFLGLAVAASLGGVAQANLVLNGGFGLPGGPDTNWYCNIGGATCPGGNPYPAGGVTDWVVHGETGFAPYNALYVNDAVLGGALPFQMPPSYYGCDVGYVGDFCLNPAGAGYFMNLDGDPGPTAISQTISGLVSGKQYHLSFSWSAVQRLDASGATTEYLEVDIGDQSLFVSPTISLPTHGFSGWFTEDVYFKWDGVGSVLRFLAHGTPGGTPPTINLDGISLIPEPSTWALLSAASLGLLGVSTRRRRTAIC